MLSCRLCRVIAADETDIPDAVYDKVALWSESFAWGNLMGFIDVDQLVLLLSVDNEGHARVMWNGMVGYVHTDYLKIIA